MFVFVSDFTVDFELKANTPYVSSTDLNTTTYSRPYLAIGTRDPFRSQVNDFSSYVEVRIQDASPVSNVDATYYLFVKSATTSIGGTTTGLTTISGAGIFLSA